jgi:hypothetical protein
MPNPTESHKGSLVKRVSREREIANPIPIENQTTTVSQTPIENQIPIRRVVIASQTITDPAINLVGIIKIEGVENSNLPMSLRR